ncbi:DUF4336 domain-containing protein [Undibacterium sp. Rencai35W]|uniref:DUF4336 domain-containing protein n=1 Tax=Undibacterium sp. Rencai35W TaxID=3413046 RepID=UPI003BF099AF
MFLSLTDNIWHVQHAFVVSGVPITSRMTIIRLTSGALWVHSPVPVDSTTKAQIDALGPVEFIVAPSKAHHLFAKKFAEHYPSANLYGAPGLADKRPDLRRLQTLTPEPGIWAPELSYLLFNGIPFANETVWFHMPTKTLVLTDLCQWWQGDLPWQSRLWNGLTGVRQRFDVPRSVRMLVRDKAAAKVSAGKILEWPIQRIVMAHNSVIEQNAHSELERAFRHFL